MQDARFFKSPAQWRKWLAANHDRAKVLWVGLHKKHTGTPSVTWPESIDEALCFGWIDGVRRSLDDDRYVIRFTPRRPRSIWSAVNIERVRVLTEAGRMRPAGLAAFKNRSEARSRVYTYERERPLELDAQNEERFKANKAAWAFFQAQPPSYRKKTIGWVMNAKKEETRLRRLAEVITESQSGRRLGLK